MPDPSELEEKPADDPAARDDAAVERVQRWDFGTIGKVTEIPGGGIRVNAYAARTGVQVYEDGKGGKTREYRDASEVFSAASLASYEDAPVTVGHPPSMLDLSTRRDYERGIIRSAERATDYHADGEEWVRTSFIVTEPEAVRRVLARELTEVSMGYASVLRPSQRADADIDQLNILINHKALLTAGQARAGRGASVRLDSGAAMAVAPTNDPAGQPRPSEGAAAPEGTPKMPVKIKIDGLGEVEQGGAEHIAHLETLAANAVKERDTAQAKADSEADEHAKAKADLKSAADKLDAQKTAAYADRVKPLTGEIKLDGMTRRQIMETAVKAKLPDFVTADRTDDYLAARIDGFLDALAEESKRDAETEAAPKMPRLDGGQRQGFQLVTHTDGQVHAFAPNGRRFSPMEVAQLEAKFDRDNQARNYTSPLVKGN